MPTDTRLDHKIIFDMIKPGSRVLDLGCGDGELLSLLIREKSCRAEGIEIDEHSIYSCFEKGITVRHENIDEGLMEYSDQQFDYVILNESLQQVIQPQKTILEALRIGKYVIAGIPNFCYFVGRLQIFFRGRVPMTKILPYEWYNTPNLRCLSLKDFRSFCSRNKVKILEQKSLTADRIVRFFPNLFANIGIFLMTK